MKDILLTPSNDLKITNGDFDFGESQDQSQLLIVLSEKSEFKEFLEIGVGIHSMLSDHNYNQALLEMKKQLEYDGMTIKDISFTKDGKLIIDGNYK
jgi:hypothetical protein